MSSIDVHHRDIKCIAPLANPGDDQTAAIAAITPSKLRQQIQQSRNDETESLGATASAKKMVDLRTNVLDALSLLETQNEDSLHRMQAVHRRVNEANANALSQLETFDDEFVYQNFVGFTIPRLIDEARMEHTVDWMNSFGVPITFPEQAEYEAYFKLLNETLLDKPGDTTGADIRRKITRPLFPFGDKKLPEMLLNMNMFVLTDVLGNTKAKLASTNASVAEIDQRIQATEAEMKDALSDENMALLDTKNGELLDHHTTKVELLAKKVRLLATGDANGGGLLSKLDTIAKSSVIPSLIREKQDLKKMTLSDIQRLEADRTTKLKENDSAISKYNNWTTKSKSKLRQNHAAQHEAWVELEAVLERLRNLGEEANVVMHEHMEVTETEQKRRQEHREYRECYATQRQTLDALIVSCDTAADFLHKADQYITCNKEKVESMQIEAHLQEMLAYEKKLFDAAYYTYGQEASSLMDKYDTRLLGLENLVAELSFQKQQAFTVEDADGSEYSKSFQNLEVSARQVRKRRDVRQDQLDHLEQLFIEIDASVEDGDDTDDSPAVRIRALQASKKDQTIEKVAELHGVQTSAAGRTKLSAAELEEAAARDREVTEAKRIARKERSSPQRLLGSAPPQ